MTTTMRSLRRASGRAAVGIVISLLAVMAAVVAFVTVDAAVEEPVIRGAGDVAARDDRVAELVKQANAALVAHHFADAERLAGQARLEAPYAAEPRLAEIDALIELGRYEAAISATRELLELRPASPAQARVSYLRELHGDVAGALDAMATARSAPPGADAAVLHALYGDLLLRTGAVEAAGRAYDAAASHSPALPAAVIGKARIAAGRGDVDRAVALLDDLLGRAPSTTATRLLAVLAPDRRAELDALGAALLDIDEANGTDVTLERAEFTGSLLDALDVTTARPTFPAWATRGWAQHLAGDDASALTSFDRATAGGWRDPVVRAHAALVRARTGDLAGARRDLALARAAGAGFPLEHAAELAEATEAVR